MGEATQPAEESNVCVAVKIRPLVTSEIDEGCRETLFVTPGCPQVSTGQHTFTYDHVFGEGGTAPDQLYARCIAPLVDGLFKGYNATVFAYGQTGSGKTFTMGSEYRPGARCRGVIPDTINDIFNRIDVAKDRAITVRVSFVEIHKEEVKDLLLPASNGPRPAVTIRETPSGDVALYGAVEKEVRSREEMAEVLELGTLCRSTASTSMNNRSSRSHAIFTITMEQRRQVQQTATQGEQGMDDDGEDDDDAPGEDAEGVEDFLGAKMHLVDLAGSERAKRTKAEGARLREGIHINRGLLALGNVINAIVDNHKHVPYRDSKLTRLLQDSLGGNSRTVMIACVSPADSNFEESLNTLRYADRARHIRNKPVVNRDPVAAQLAVLRNTIAQLKSENTSLKRALVASGSEGGLDVVGTSGLGNSALESLVDRLTQENSSLESENLRLKMDVDELRREMAVVMDKWHTAKAQCDLLRMNQAAAAAGLQHRLENPGEVDRNELPLPGLDIVKGYVARIAELEAEVKSMKSLAVHFPYTRRRSNAVESHTLDRVSAAEDLDPASPVPSSMLDGAHAVDCANGEGEADDNQQSELAVEEEEIFMAELAAHTLSQEKMKKEVALLQRQLEAKERKMVELMKNAGSMPALKQHYDRVLADLEAQRDTLVAERKALMEKLNAVSAANEEERKRLEATYIERIHQYDERLKELRRKERDFIAMQKLKQRTEDAHRRLSADIVRLKQQKVTVQKQLEANAKQFAQWRHERERELGQLRKQSRKDRAQIQHLQAMAAKQSAVLQRKISDATAARKRIKELEEEKRRKAAAATSQQQATAALALHQSMGGNIEVQPNAQAPVLRTDKERREWLQKELEMCNMSCEFRKVIDGELAQRAEATRKLKELEKRLTHLDQVHPASPLLMAGGVTAPVSLSPNTAAIAGTLAANAASDPEYREKLLSRRKELEEEVAYHNEQITELQADWERQKAEEESRGGGALDIRRWTGLRNVAECRELLRTLFRMNVESKTLSNELTVDMVRYMEEVEVLRVQLDGAQKKCAQYRKLAVSLQAAAALVAAAPPHSTMSTQDETDKQVDAVLEALHVVRNNTPPGAVGKIAGTTGADVKNTPGDVEMEDARSPGTPGVAQNGPAKALEFLSPVPSGAKKRLSSYRTSGGAALRYSPDHNIDSDYDGGDDQADHPNKSGRAVSKDDPQLSDEMEVDGDPEVEGSSDGEGNDVEGDDSERGSDDEEEEESSGSEVSDGDVDWDPQHATPAVRARGARASRRFSSLTGIDSGAGSFKCSSRRQSPAGSGAPSVDSDRADAPKGRRGSKGSGSRRATTSNRSSNATADAATALEAPVLDHINLRRMCNGGNSILRLQKLTVAVLKEALKGMVIDGQKWTAGTKTRAMMIQDYRRMLGLDKVPSQSSAHSSDQDIKGAICLAYTDSNGTAAVLHSRVENSGGGTGEISVGGAKEVEIPQVDSSSNNPADEGFTFSPHLPTAPITASSGAMEVSPLAAIRSASPCQTSSGRRLATGNSMGPWARSSLVAQAHSARQYTTWASSLRSSCTLPSTDAASNFVDAPSPAATGHTLMRSSSGIGTSLASRGSAGASLPVGTVVDLGAGTSRRQTAWVALSAGQGAVVPGPQREPLSYRGAVLASPHQSPSSRLPRPPVQVAPGSASPCSSMSSPTTRSVPRSAGKLGGGRMYSPGLSPESRERSFGYTGGENMQPDVTTPRGTTNSAASEGKTTPLTSLYKAKAAASRERTAALRVSMQKNWEHQEPPISRGSGLSGNARSSVNVGTTGTVTSSPDGPIRAAPGLRDSTGSFGGAGKQQKAIWR